MGVQHIDKLTDNMKKVLSKTFPSYSGRKFKIVINDFPERLDSYWDEGSRTYYAFYDISSGKEYSMPSNHPFFEKDKPRNLGGALLKGVILVANSIFLGKDMGITFYVNDEDYEWIYGQKALAEPELDREKKIVLVYTRSRKSSYGGVNNYRFIEAHADTKITKEQWEIAKEWLIKNMYLNSAGAITIKGKNAIVNTREYELR